MSVTSTDETSTASSRLRCVAEEAPYCFGATQNLSPDLRSTQQPCERRPPGVHAKAGHLAIWEGPALWSFQPLSARASSPSSAYSTTQQSIMPPREWPSPLLASTPGPTNCKPQCATGLCSMRACLKEDPLHAHPNLYVYEYDADGVFRWWRVQ